MNLQKFVSDVIEAMGGIVVPLEFALCEVIIPEAYKDWFVGRSELKLAFDLEVAEENPDAEFVTFGSFLFEQLIGFVRRNALATVLFVEADKQPLHDPPGKIKRFLRNEHLKLTVLNEQWVNGIWACFSFRIAWIADGKEEQFREVLVDLAGGKVDQDMLDQLRFYPCSEAQNDYAPVFRGAPEADLSDAMQIALQSIRKEAEEGKARRTNLGVIERETQRIIDYYNQLAAETLKRSERKGLGEAKKQEILAKAGAVELEKEKQIHDVRSRFQVKTELSLDHGVLYVAPLIEFTIRTQYHREQKEQVLYYNPMLKQFYENGALD